MALPVTFKFEGTNLVVAVDTDKDGVNLLNLSLNLAEVPSEVLALITKKKEEAPQA